MKRFFIIILGMLMTALAYSQAPAVKNWTEDFDNTITFSVIPANSWIPATQYHYQLPGSSATTPRSCLGFVPNTIGDTSILQTQIYDCTPYTYVILRFDHICKVSPMDIVKIQYRRDMGAGMGAWDSLPVISYQGTAANFSTKGVFSAASYSDWVANDSTVFPTQSWWKGETFDLSYDAQQAAVQFRFIIIHGNVQGSQTSFGWFIDNFHLQASAYEVIPPVVKILSISLKDTVYSTGPWEVEAKVATRTNARIETPWVVYTATKNGVSTIDSVIMTNVAGDSLWRAFIPQFEVGTTVNYSITGRDTTGNEAFDSLVYTIVPSVISPGSATVTIGGTGTTTTDCYTPIGTCEQYAWSRQLYLASEMGTASAGRMITSFEWESASFSATLNNQKCYLQLVTDATLSVGYIDPQLAGATKVLDGSITFSPGWCKITLNQPFYLAPGKNLQIHWENKHGVSVSGNFKRTTLANTTVDAHGPANNIHTYTGTVTGDRPDLRLNFLTAAPDNSAAISSIDIKDTILVAPGMTIPIVVSVKNRGTLNLSTATIHYSVNGVEASQTYNWTGNLSWDMNKQDTIDWYSPTVNGHDTIKVWVELPNGQTDGITDDDMQTKIVYGSSDISLSFVNSPTDSVYTTGPFPVSASITTLSGSLISAVSLDVVINFNGTSTPVSLPMTFDAAANLWKLTIPQAQYGTDISYSITLTDTLGNVATDTNIFYIRRHISLSGMKQIGTGTGEYNRDSPLHTYHYNSWSKQMYLESEIDEDMRGGKITKIAWNYVANGQSANFGTAWSRNNQRCYMRLVSDADLSNSNYQPYQSTYDPV
ncbi:MAG: hypothetical protein LBE13_05660, partial [Bacteroidales bacterium]|nr:hypothetical protein [Bacteroidales bacterium]